MASTKGGWEIDPAFATRAAGPPAAVFPGEDLDADKVESARGYWRTLTAKARRCCALKAGEQVADDVRATKMGGTPLWSRAELDAWPLCDECGDEMRLRYQLRRADVPGLICRPGTDMLQLYWCINDCGEEQASCWHRWLAEASVAEPLEVGLSVPEPARALIIAERDDFPSISEHSENHEWLESGVTDLVIEGHEDDEFLDAWRAYHSQDEKVGGYVSWVQWGWRCCTSSLYLVLQTEWSEGYQYLMACQDCGAVHTEYQGT